MHCWKHWIVDWMCSVRIGVTNIGGTQALDLYLPLAFLSRLSSFSNSVLIQQALIDTSGNRYLRG